MEEPSQVSVLGLDPMAIPSSEPHLFGTTLATLTRNLQPLKPGEATTLRPATRRSLTHSEVIDRHRILEQGVIACHHGDPTVGNEIALAVRLLIEADRCTFRNVNIAINNCSLNAAMPAHVYV